MCSFEYAIYFKLATTWNWLHDAITPSAGADICYNWPCARNYVVMKPVLSGELLETSSVSVATELCL